MTFSMNFKQFSVMFSFGVFGYIPSMSHILSFVCVLHFALIEAQRNFQSNAQAIQNENDASQAILQLR